MTGMELESSEQSAEVKKKFSTFVKETIVSSPLLTNALSLTFTLTHSLTHGRSTVHPCYALGGFALAAEGSPKFLELPDSD